VPRLVSRTPDADPAPATTAGDGASNSAEKETDTEQDPLKVLSPEEFADVVEVFRILKRWRDEARR
jgi:hypothetical protein